MSTTYKPLSGTLTPITEVRILLPQPFKNRSKKAVPAIFLLITNANLIKLNKYIKNIDKNEKIAAIPKRKTMVSRA